MLIANQLKEHVLNRIGYGLSVWHSARYDALGAAGYISEQLGQTLEPLSLGDDDVFVNTKLRRSVVARRQLEAVLLDFWFNHFNVDATTNNPANRTTVTGANIAQLQNDAIAPQLLGDFGSMLLATAQAPSMLNYLNNDQNRKSAVLADGTIVGYNENYARELLELHTVGIDGGYDEHDVLETARVLTGWGRANDEFIYRSGRHDVGRKSIMGREYPAGAEIEEGQALLAFLAAHPSTARHLSRKLCVRFVGDKPPTLAIKAASKRYEDTTGDLGATTAEILNGPAFVTATDQHFRSKVKPPHRYAASALMAMGAVAVSDWSSIESDIVRLIIRSGDTPYFFIAPTGYPEADSYWLSGVSALGRFELAELIGYEPRLVQLLRKRSGSDGSDIGEAYEAIKDHFLPGGVSSATEAAVKEHAAANAATNNQRISAIAHMLLASPEFSRY